MPERKVVNIIQSSVTRERWYLYLECYHVIIRRKPTRKKTVCVECASKLYERLPR
jgi:hypothetical protein